MSEPESPPPQPSGLLALLLLPLQAALASGLKLFAALVSGILSAAIPGMGKDVEEDSRDQHPDPVPPARDTDDNP